VGGRVEGREDAVEEDGVEETYRAINLLRTRMQGQGDTFDYVLDTRAVGCYLERVLWWAAGFHREYMRRCLYDRGIGLLLKRKRAQTDLARCTVYRVCSRCVHDVSVGDSKGHCHVVGMRVSPRSTKSRQVRSVDFTS